MTDNISTNEHLWFTVINVVSAATVRAYCTATVTNKLSATLNLKLDTPSGVLSLYASFLALQIGDADVVIITDTNTMFHLQVIQQFFPPAVHDFYMASSGF